MYSLVNHKNVDCPSRQLLITRNRRNTKLGLLIIDNSLQGLLRIGLQGRQNRSNETSKQAILICKDSLNLMRLSFTNRLKSFKKTLNRSQIRSCSFSRSWLPRDSTNKSLKQRNLSKPSVDSLLCSKRKNLNTVETENSQRRWSLKAASDPKRTY